MSESELEEYQAKEFIKINEIKNKELLKLEEEKNKQIKSKINEQSEIYQEANKIFVEIID
jgi:hypothetical protein